MTRLLGRALVGATFVALVVAATSPAWRLLWPGSSSADEAILRSLCGPRWTRAGPAIAASEPTPARTPAPG